MNNSQQQTSSQTLFDQRFDALRVPLSASLQKSLMPLFSGGTSTRSIQTLEGTACCVESDGYRFLVTAKHVLDELADDVWVRAGMDKLVPLEDCQRIEIPDSDICLLEIGLNQSCKHIHPIHIDVCKSLESQAVELLYMEGYPASKNKIPHIKGLKPMGFSVRSALTNNVSERLLAKCNNHDCLVTIDHSNYTDQSGDDANLPSLPSMSGSPVFLLGSVEDVANQQCTPAPIGVFVREYRQEKIGVYEMLQPAIKLAINELNENRSTYQLRDIRRNRDAISELLAEYNVTDLRIFGSVARNENNKNSDVDLVAKFDRGYDILRNRVPLTDKLAHIINSDVDLIPEHELSSTMREAVLQHALPL